MPSMEAVMTHCTGDWVVVEQHSPSWAGGANGNEKNVDQRARSDGEEGDHVDRGGCAAAGVGGMKGGKAEKGVKAERVRLIVEAYLAAVSTLGASLSSVAPKLRPGRVLDRVRNNVVVAMYYGPLNLCTAASGIDNAFPCAHTAPPGPVGGVSDPWSRPIVGLRFEPPPAWMLPGFTIWEYEF